MNNKANEMLFPVNLCPVSSNHHLVVHLPAALTSPTGHMVAGAVADPKLAGQPVHTARPRDCHVLNSERVELRSDDIIACYYICNYSDLCKVVEIVWKSRQTCQMAEEPRFLKLPSTAPSRADLMGALEPS